MTAAAETRGPGEAGSAERASMRWLRRRYGAGPLHLLTLVACFALAGYAVTRIRDQGGLSLVFIWFIVSLVGHDLVLWPLYALADRSAIRLTRRHPGRVAAVPWINHVHVPVIVSAVLLGISMPLVLRLSSTTYRNYAGVSESPYLGHWLLVTGLLFAGSALLYAVRLGRTQARRPVPDDRRAAGPGDVVAEGPSGDVTGG